MRTRGATLDMPKSVKLSPSLDFATITLAKKHFDPFRTGGELNQDLPPDQFGQLKLLYERYCANTGFPPTVRRGGIFPDHGEAERGIHPVPRRSLGGWHFDDVFTR
jgi:hypothetical protein